MPSSPLPSPWYIEVTGPVSYSWMYPIERSLRTLKNDIETQFARDERNDDTIVENEIIDDIEIFKQKVQPLGASSVYTISQEEKQLFHWYIPNNVDEISEYRNGLMVIDESNASGSEDNNFYGVLDEVLHVQYPLERNVLLFKCWWTDIDPIVVERPIMRHVTDDFIDDVNECIISSSYPRNNFLEMDATFFEFEDDLDNLAGRSSSVGDNSDEVIYSTTCDSDS
ncbi:uncharacterized protein E5676_scaffold128G00030 [Cucumis melo var. makuwa]|uniref:DUF4216 domain-containing protein n=1 Tax=Cucumis melo var. makuwa TaxID=1194695 RepID=A0A5D3BPD7_CUCMM|nr:uncharacterized protein E6C27_scaffold268G00040 [Cucumis melo var. makuwa]TYK01641.1 uncharacterized protein E5676_scaffold128G00030 [Cucumis melo var. makuwa]